MMSNERKIITAHISSGNTRYLTIAQWNQYHPWPSKRGLRALILKAPENGFEMAFVRVGRRILIDEKAFFEWMKII